MAKYMLIAYDKVETYAQYSPEQMQAIVERYMAWTRDIASEGHLVMGEKLVDGHGKAVTKSQGALSVSDGPFTEAKEVVGGFWILNCDTEQQAMDIAASCPHADSGVLGLKQVDPTS